MKPLTAPLAWALVIMGLCAIPGRDLPHFSFLEILQFDKWVHAGVFFILVILCVRGFCRMKNPWTPRKAFFIAVLFAISYGGALEFLQEAVFADRTADLYDFIANAAGSLAALPVYPYLARTFPRLNLPMAK